MDCRVSIHPLPQFPSPKSSLLAQILVPPTLQIPLLSQKLSSHPSYHYWSSESSKVKERAIRGVGYAPPQLLFHLSVTGDNTEQPAWTLQGLIIFLYQHFLLLGQEQCCEEKGGGDRVLYILIRERSCVNSCEQAGGRQHSPHLLPALSSFLLLSALLPANQEAVRTASPAFSN